MSVRERILALRMRIDTAVFFDIVPIMEDIDLLPPNFRSDLYRLLAQKLLSWLEDTDKEETDD